MADAKDLSERDQKLLDLLVTGKSEKVAGEAFGISQQRVNAIRRTPAAVAYLQRHGGDTKAMLYAKAGAEILARMDWGGIKLADLLAIWKAAMPQEINVNLAVAEAARIVAERRGLTPEQTATIVDLASRRKAS